MKDEKKTETIILLRPFIKLEEYEENTFSDLISVLGKIRKENNELADGEYKELLLTNRQYIFSRGDIIVAVNNDVKDYTAEISVTQKKYLCALNGKFISASDGKIKITIKTIAKYKIQSQTIYT